METRRWLTVAILICLFFAVSAGREVKVKQKLDLPVYNHTLATILVEYASAVYLSELAELFSWTCSRCKNLTKGFEIIEVIVDVPKCLQAFVGVAEDLDAIVIAFRGTKPNSISNWISDLHWIQLDLNYPGTSDAMVHHGFYKAYHNTTLRPEILSSIEKAKKLYGDLKIIVTGHSFGGAMASLCGLDLTVNFKAQNVQVITFGQPRIGNAAFASYYSQHVPNTIRVTHKQDIVPHLPLYYRRFPQKTYHHFPTEVWLHDTVETVCDASGEDPNCSRSSVRGYNILDHLNYYGAYMGVDTVDICRLVMDSRVAMYSTQDHNGNFILSKIPSSTVLQTNTDSDRFP